MTLNLRMFLA